MSATMKIESLRSLSLIYSNPMLRNILSDNNLSSIENRLSRHRDCLGLTKEYNQFIDILSSIYESMTENYCNEYIYKNTILNEMIINQYSFETTTLLNEFKISKSIADLVFVNGEVRLFEIKTDLDTLIRLNSQLEDYRKAVEKIFIVTSYKYISQISEMYKDSSYGIIELGKDHILRPIKDAISDKAYFEHEVIFKILRKNEYLDIIRNEFGYVPNVPNTLIFRKCLELVKELDVVKFQDLTFKKLKHRKLNEPDLLIDSNTPQELRFLCHSLNMDRDQYHTLFHLLKSVI